jgi:hypothetical protein
VHDQNSRKHVVQMWCVGGLRRISNGHTEAFCRCRPASSSERTTVRTTGFEPATLTLAKKSGPTPLPASLQIHAARSAISIDHNEPRVPVVVSGACVFCAPRTAESRTTCTTFAGWPPASGGRSAGKAGRQVMGVTPVLYRLHFGDRGSEGPGELERDGRGFKACRRTGRSAIRSPFSTPRD